MEHGTLDELRNGTLGDEDLVLSFAKMKPSRRQIQLPIRSVQSKEQSILPMMQKRRFKEKIKEKINYNHDLEAEVAAGQADEMDEDSDGGFFEEAGGVRIDKP